MNLPAEAFVEFYKFWHTRLGFKGAGFLLRTMAKVVPPLRRYPLHVPGIGTIPVNFSDVSGFFWINQLMGEEGHEDGITQFLKRASVGIEKPVCIWDVGANAGFFAATILNSVPHVSRLRLFEPNPLVFDVLDALAKQNHVVRFSNIALSDQEGKISFSYPLGQTPLTRRGGVDKYGVVFQAEVTTGDLFSKETPEEVPDIIIIDVEGFEKEVIKGMRELISKSLPIVIVEHIFHHPETLDDLFPEGYQRFTINDSGGALIEGFDLGAGHNSVYLHPLKHKFQ